MKRLSQVTVLVAVLCLPVLAGEIGSVGIVPPPPPPPPPPPTASTVIWDAILDILFK